MTVLKLKWYIRRIVTFIREVRYVPFPKCISLLVGKKDKYSDEQRHATHGQKNWIWDYTVRKIAYKIAQVRKIVYVIIP